MSASEDYKLDFIRSMANFYWRLEGRPDGEEYRDSKWGRMKIRDIHWRRAEEEYDTVVLNPYHG